MPTNEQIAAWQQALRGYTPGTAQDYWNAYHGLQQTSAPMWQAQQYGNKWLPGAQADVANLPMMEPYLSVPQLEAMNLTNIGARMDQLLPSAAQQYTPEQLTHFQSPEYLDWLQQRALGVIPAAYKDVAPMAGTANVASWQQQPNPNLYAVVNQAKWQPGALDFAPTGQLAVAQEVADARQNPMFELREHVRRMFEGAKAWAPGGSKGVVDRRTLEQQAQYQQQMQDWLNWQPAEIGQPTPDYYTKDWAVYPTGEPVSQNAASNAPYGVGTYAERQRRSALMNKAWQAWQPFLKKVFLPGTEEGGGLVPGAAETKEMAGPYRWRMWNEPVAAATTKTWTPRFG